MTQPDWPQVHHIVFCRKARSLLLQASGRDVPVHFPPHICSVFVAFVTAELMKRNEVGEAKDCEVPVAKAHPWLLPTAKAVFPTRLSEETLPSGKIDEHSDNDLRAS